MTLNIKYKLKKIQTDNLLNYAIDTNFCTIKQRQLIRKNIDNNNKKIKKLMEELTK